MISNMSVLQCEISVLSSWNFENEVFCSINTVTLFFVYNDDICARQRVGKAVQFSPGA